MNREKINQTGFADELESARPDEKFRVVIGAATTDDFSMLRRYMESTGRQYKPISITTTMSAELPAITIRELTAQPYVEFIDRGGQDAED